MTTRYLTCRRGFTLIELLVAMAASLGIMLIITEASKMAVDITRVSQSNGELVRKLRGARIILDHDLTADHFPFDSGFTGASGGVKLRDHRFDLGAPAPKGGFFHIEAPMPTYGPSPYAIQDQEGNTISTATNHVLHFTSIFRGGTSSELFEHESPAGSSLPTDTYRSKAAEVAYFLIRMPDGDMTSAGPGALPLWKLVRRTRLIAMDDEQQMLNQAVIRDTPPAYTGAPTHHEVISVPLQATGVLTSPPSLVNTLGTITNPNNRLRPLLPLPATKLDGTTNPRYGEETVLTHVLSFEVKVWWDRSTLAGTLVPPPGQYGVPRAPYPAFPAGTPANTDTPYDWLIPGAAVNGVFDTSNPNNRIRVRGIQIKLLIADTQVGIAKSSTWVFEL